MKPTRHGPITWHVDSPEPALREALDRADWLAAAELIKENRVRSVYRLTLANGERAFVKHDHPTGLRGWLKALFRSKARAEFEACRRLVEAGVPVVAPLAWGKSDGGGFLVTAEVPGCEDFEPCWSRTRNGGTRAPFLEGLASLLERLWTAGVDHPDMHAGNVLVQVREEGPAAFRLVDVYGVRTSAQGDTHGRRVRLLRWLRPLLSELSADEREPLLRAVGVQSGPDQADLLARLRLSARRWHRRKWPDRRRRYLTAGSLCSVHDEADGVWVCRRPFELANARRAVAQHRAQCDRGSGVLKRDRKRLLSRAAVGSGTAVVKEFVRPGVGPWSADRRSWLNTNRLDMYSLPAARPLAWHRSKAGHGYVILEDLGDTLLHSRLRDAGNAALRRRWLKAAALLVAALHDAGVDHRDLKLSNLMVRAEGSAPFAGLGLVDLDAVWFLQPFRPRQRARALAPLLESMPRPVTTPEKLRFVVVYGRAAGLDRGARRDLFERLRARKML